MAAAIAGTGWNAISNARATDSRVALAAELRALEPLLAERARLDGIDAQAREQEALSARLAAPRAELVALIDALSRESDPGIALYRLHQTHAGVELRAGAGDTGTAAGWAERLGRLPGVRSAELTDMRTATRSAFPVDVVARLEWSRADAADVRPAPRPPRARP